jgi:hypothetical protein
MHPELDLFPVQPIAQRDLAARRGGFQRVLQHVAQHAPQQGRIADQRRWFFGRRQPNGAILGHGMPAIAVYQRAQHGLGVHVRQIDGQFVVLGAQQVALRADLLDQAFGQTAEQLEQFLRLRDRLVEDQVDGGADGAGGVEHVVEKDVLQRAAAFLVPNVMDGEDRQPVIFQLKGHGPHAQVQRIARPADDDPALLHVGLAALALEDRPHCAARAAEGGRAAAPLGFIGMDAVQRLAGPQAEQLAVAPFQQVQRAAVGEDDLTLPVEHDYGIGHGVEDSARLRGRGHETFGQRRNVVRSGPFGGRKLRRQGSCLQLERFVVHHLYSCFC